MNKHEKLERLTAEVIEEVERRAKQQGLLKDDESLHFIVSFSPILIRRGRVVADASTPLTEKDWEKIVAVKWSEDQNKFLTKLKNTQNRAIHLDTPYSFVSNFNSTLAKAGLPYRLLSPLESEAWDSVPYRIYKIISRESPR